MYLKETDWEGMHCFASELGQVVGFGERGDEISFSTNAGNFLTSLETTVLGLLYWCGTVWHCVALCGTRVHNPKQLVTFATTHIRCLLSFR